MAKDVEKFKTSVNDVTGDLIKTKASNQQAYADNWERIFGKKEDMLKQLVDEGKLNPNVQRRHEEMNIGKGKFTQDDVEVSVETPNGKVVIEGYAQEGVEQFIPLMEEEPTVLVFTEQLLPSGIIEDEI